MTAISSNSNQTAVPIASKSSSTDAQLGYDHKKRSKTVPLDDMKSSATDKPNAAMHVNVAVPHVVASASTSLPSPRRKSTAELEALMNIPQDDPRLSEEGEYVTCNDLIVEPLFCL